MWLAHDERKPFQCWDLSSEGRGHRRDAAWFQPPKTNWNLRTQQTSRAYTHTQILHHFNTTHFQIFLQNTTAVRFWPIAVPRLRSARPSCPLIGWSLWDPGDLKGGDARHSVIKPLLHTTAVHHILDAGDGQRRLGHVSGDDTQTRSSGRRTENLNTQHI